MSYFTVDQAGKVENTSEDTILALCSDKIQYSIKLPKELKQNLFNQCNKRFKKQLTFRIFAYSLSLLLKNKLHEGSIIVIDNEYPGHERDIKQLLLNNLNINKEQIKFDSLGKKDMAHRIANQTFSGRLKPNEILTGGQISLNQILPKRKLREYLK